MALHTDIPTRREIERLLATREPWCVSIYLPTTPVTQDADVNRIVLKNHVSMALEQLHDAGAPKPDIASIEEALEHLVDDHDFWAVQANSLALFATPDRVRTFRLPNQLTDSVQVSDRFLVKPLLRTVSFPQSAFVLELAQGSVRLLQIAPDIPTHQVHVAELPSDIASSVGKTSIDDGGRLQSSEGQKVRMRQYCRAIDSGLRSVLAGLDLPLILASAQPLDAIYRSVNSYPHLVEQGISGNPEAVLDGDLAAAARKVLDQVYAAELEELRGVFAARHTQGRAATDVVDVARAATFGAVDTVLVDIDAEVPGLIDETSGVVSFDDEDGKEYGVIDEIARRVLLADGRVLAVRADDIPGGGPAAAILRYPV